MRRHLGGEPVAVRAASRLYRVRRWARRHKLVLSSTLAALLGAGLIFFAVVRREVTLTGSMIYQDEFPEAIRLIAEGAVRPGPLVTHRFPLAEIGHAFAVHEEPTSIKVAVAPAAGGA